jgi:hypothetical protein
MKRYLTSRTLIIVLGAWLALSTGGLAAFALAAAPPNTRAVFLMGTGLVILWVGLCGLAMLLFREPVRKAVQAVRADWRIKFVILATILALVEEAITTTMTNLAPLFGVPVGAAYITASTNYLDVVCLHSVVVFVPMFIAWAVLLRYADFTPNAVFLLFGLTGTLGEAIYGGTQALAEVGMWVFVYGLMVYLPAYTLPPERGARPPRWWHYLLALVLPILFAIPVALVVSTLHPIDVHFSPIVPGS